MAEDRMYLSVDENPDGPGLIAVITQGHPRAGDANCTVLTLEIVEDMAAAERWYERMKVEKPWESRQ